jgi:hypothetical protein
MFLVSGRVVLSISFQNPVDFVLVDVAVQIPIHHHDRGMIAGTETDHGKKRHASIRRGVA